jgi:UDP-N-acetylmuramyl-tripeptide synthetase
MTPVREIHALLQPFAAIALTGAMDDSRRVEPGDLFLAYPGHDANSADGRRFIAQAIEKGAAAVCWEPGGDFTWNPAWTLPNVPVKNLRALAGPLAHELAGRPSESLALLAITGTNGKTSISQWLARVYPETCATIGTLGAGFPEAMTPTGLTTPEATTLARLLADEHRQGARACALEASSIGIEEGRMNGLRVDTAIFTNCTRDHLDYHQNMEAYAAAKEKLFVWPRLRLAVLNLDDALGQRLARVTTASKIMGYSLEGRNDVTAIVHAESLATTATGQTFLMVTSRGRARVETALLGRYNVSNLLAVAAVLLDQGVNVAKIAEQLSSLAPPPGRMERYGDEASPLVAVDYAHTPDALENALVALRPVAAAREGRLICVFGCGGERDKGKRPLMGEIAARNADEVWITSDNPRSEAPQEIIADIRQGIAKLSTVKIEPERGLAIRAAIAAAADTDVILVAGKGHEPYQEIAGIRLPFSDGEVVRQALKARQNERETSCAGA